MRIARLAAVALAASSLVPSVAVRTGSTVAIGPGSRISLRGGKTATTAGSFAVAR